MSAVLIDPIEFQGTKVHMQPLSPTTEDKMSRMEILIPLYSNIIVKTFCFPTNLGGEINVHEYMAESKLTYILPKQLLWVAYPLLLVVQNQFTIFQLIFEKYMNKILCNANLSIKKCFGY